MIWREKRVLLLILAALLLGNVVFFLTYRVQYQERLNDLDDRLTQAEAQLAKSREGRMQAEEQLLAFRKVEKDVSTVYDQQWSTQQRRLTLLIAEVKRLAEASNAIPRSYSFAKGEAKDERTQTRKRDAALGASEVAINFSVEATYDQVRRMINLIELSNQFVIIEAINLSAGRESQLTLTLKLKTLFRDEQQPVATNRL